MIAAVGDIYNIPAFFSGGHTPDLVVSEKYAKKLMGELFTELINVKYEDAFSKETEQKVKVLGNSIGFIIAMLAVLNFLNMMAAGVENRAREFATLESIGMTTKQIKKMLQTEGIGYAVISIFRSLGK